jgi:hypothetical protein
MFRVFCPVACEGVLVVSVVEDLRVRQEAQVSAVEVLERRAVQVAAAREVLASEEREYAREWAVALKVDVPESVLTGGGLEVPVAPARARVKSSRSQKKEQPKVVPEVG